MANESRAVSDVQFLETIYLFLIRMMYIFQDMQPRRVPCGSSSTSGRVSAISSSLTSQGASSSALERHRPMGSVRRRKA